MSFGKGTLAVQRFRSLWGVEPGPGLEYWKVWYPQLKKQGYAGIEVDIHGLDPENVLAPLRQLCDDIGLQINALIFTSWPQYQGARPSGLSPDLHLNRYREQLRAAAILKPVRVNAQSGADHWTWDQSVEFFRGTLQIDAELGLSGKVSHETHRNRSLFNPYVTAFVLENVPQLQLTGDFSHWVLVCERILDRGEEDRELLDKIFPHVSHLHTRIGTTQSSQCPDPTHPAFKPEREFFERIWKRVIDAKMKSSETDPLLTFVPEYGPFPYHPHGSATPHGEVADAEGARLQKVFEEYIVQQIGEKHH